MEGETAEMSHHSKLDCRSAPLSAEALQAVLQEVISTNTWHHYHGPSLDRLAEMLCVEYDRTHCVLCCSGTTGIELALRGVGVRPGHEVIMAAYDFRAAMACTLQLNARPVLVDVLPDQPVIDVEAVAGAITAKTRAIVFSHLHGFTAPIQQLRKLADEHGLMLIDDSCQSPGLSRVSDAAAPLEDVIVLSFGGSKLLTSGRGGAVLTSSETIAQRIRLHTWRGNETVPLSEIQAALVIPQLDLLHHANRERGAAVQTLLRETADNLPFHFMLSDRFWQQSVDDAGRSTAVFYKLPVLLPVPLQKSQRERLLMLAQAYGLPLGKCFDALHTVSAKSRYRAAGTLERSRKLSAQMLVLHHTALRQELCATVLESLKQLLGACATEAP